MEQSTARCKRFVLGLPQRIQGRIDSMARQRSASTRGPSQALDQRGWLPMLSSQIILSWK